MEDLVGRWTSPAWRGEAQAWIDERLATAGSTRTGPTLQPRVRFWSTQLTAETSAGRVWFKENSPPNRFEAALTAEVHRVAPGSCLRPLAVDAERGWLLLPDGGRTVWEHATEAGGPPSAQTWTELLAQYGGLQVALAAEPGVLATGCPRSGVGDAVTAAGAALVQATRYPAGHPLRLSTGDAETLARGLPLVAAAAAMVADLGLPDSLQHNDLHDGNAFMPARGTAFRFFDLGDAVWGSPLCSLLVPVGVLAEQWQCPVEDGRVIAVCEGYLRTWTAYAPLDRLRSALPAAFRLAALHRYEAWRRVIDASTPEGVGEVATGAGRWLRKALT